MSHVTIADFVREAHSHAEEALRRFEAQVGLLEDVNRTFSLANEALTHLPESQILVPLFFLQAHAAFLTTAQLSTSGQVASAYGALRSLLEYGAYAAHVVRHPESGRLWLDRHQTESGRKRVRDAFHPNRLSSTIKHLKASLWLEYERLYERAIDFGGHPNERALSGRIDLSRNENNVRVAIAFLSTRDTAHQVAFKSLYHAGIIVLDLFSLSFPERFLVSGATEKIAHLRTALDEA